MTAETELEARAAELRRLVYGTPGGHETGAVDELVVVEAALARLREASDQGAKAPAADPAAVGEEGDTVATEVESPVVATPRPHKRRAHPLLIAGLALAVAVAVGPAADPDAWSHRNGSDDIPAPMTFYEWSSARLAAHGDGS